MVRCRSQSTNCNRRSAPINFGVCKVNEEVQNVWGSKGATALDIYFLTPSLTSTNLNWWFIPSNKATADSKHLSHAIRVWETINFTGTMNAENNEFLMQTFQVYFTVSCQNFTMGFDNRKSHNRRDSDSEHRENEVVRFFYPIESIPQIREKWEHFIFAGKNCCYHVQHFHFFRILFDNKRTVIGWEFEFNCQWETNMD